MTVARTPSKIPTYNRAPLFLLVAVLLSAPLGWFLFWLVGG